MARRMTHSQMMKKLRLEKRRLMKLAKKKKQMSIRRERALRKIRKRKREEMRLKKEISNLKMETSSSIKARIKRLHKTYKSPETQRKIKKAKQMWGEFQKFADKYGRKKYITPTVIISCIGFFIIPFLAATAEPILILYVFAFSSILTVLLGIQTPLNAWSQDLLPEEKRGKFLGILNITLTLSQVIGAMVGGIVATLFGLPVAFAFAPIFFIISLPIFMRIKETLPGIEN